MSTLRKHPVVLVLLVVFLLVSLTQEPTRSAEAVGEAWNGIVSGTGSFIDGFFTFVESLGSSA